MQARHAMQAGMASKKPAGTGGLIHRRLPGRLAQDRVVSRVGRWLASQARMTASTSAERRVFSQSLSRLSSQDGPDTIGEAAMADFSSSSSAAGNSYSIDAPHSASDIFRRPFTTGYLAPNSGRTRLPRRRLVS